MAAIDVHNLSKRYGTLTALDRANLTVEEGEIFGFLGPNGAGKSTMINLFLDFIRPTEGSVSIFGHDCQQEGKQARERMGVLPEGYDVYGRLTGRQHIEFAIESKDADVRPMAVLDRVGIADAADRPAGGYSKGMAQRLVFGMALVGEPDLLVLDEPTTGLDPNGARKMRTIIREENDRGATIFFSSHILEQVEAVCDRVGILYDGTLVAVDTIDDLRASLTGGTKLVVDITPAALDIQAVVRDIPGVDTVQVSDDGTRIEATCNDDAKMDIVLALNEAGADVTNFRTEEASLEDLFAEYTGGSR